MFLQIADGGNHQFGRFLHVTNACIAVLAQKSAYRACLMIMINKERSFTLREIADSALPILGFKKFIVMLCGNSVAVTQSVAALGVKALTRPVGFIFKHSLSQCDAFRSSSKCSIAGQIALLATVRQTVGLRSIGSKLNNRFRLLAFIAEFTIGAVNGLLNSLSFKLSAPCGLNRRRPLTVNAARAIAIFETFIFPEIGKRLGKIAGNACFMWYVLVGHSLNLLNNLKLWLGLCDVSPSFKPFQFYHKTAVIITV
jgi:hypothetical protein